MGELADVKAILKEHKQEHLLQHYDNLNAEEQSYLLSSIKKIDFKHLRGKLLLNISYCRSFFKYDYEYFETPVMVYRVLCYKIVRICVERTLYHRLT